MLRYYPMDHAFVLAFGLIIGSFANVCVWRLPRGESLVSPPSHCPFCGTRIGVRDNIPLISFIILKARCRICRHPISWRYPIVEAATGILALASHFRFGLSQAGLEVFLLSVLFLILLATDLETRLLPDSLTVGGLVLPLGFPLLAGMEPEPLDLLLGAAVGSALFLFILLIHFHARGYYGMGYGDVKLMALSGACFGFPGFFKPLIASCVLALAVSVPFILAKGKSWKYPIPFGAFLAGGSLIWLFIK